MDVSEIFNGIAVIIDDEIDDNDSDIGKIRKSIQNRNIPVVTYKKIPDKAIVKALSNASFLIVDWDYEKGALGVDIESGERVTMPPDYKEYQENVVIEFLSEVNNNVFVPIFLFTSKHIDTIKDSLVKAGLWQSEEKKNRIFIKAKNEVNTDEELFKTMEMWLKDMSSAYVLKEWERHARKAINDMFLDMYNRSPFWVEILWKMMKKDAIEYQYEFGEFLTRSLCNRMEKCEFEEEIISGDCEVDNPTKESEEDSNEEEIAAEELVLSELLCVLEGERYIAYKLDEQPKQFYTGDLFKKGSKYYLNIKAQCDLARKPNPELYLIEGKVLKDEEIYTGAIQLTTDRYLDFGNGQKESLAGIEEICANEEKLRLINDKMYNHGNKTLLKDGAFIEKANSVIVGCIAGKRAIQFNLYLIIKKPLDLGDRIGRVLPPYITRIQQRCAQFIIREGIMPVPEELFK